MKKNIKASICIILLVVVVFGIYQWNQSIQNEYKRKAEEAFRNSGIGGYKPSEVIDALRTEFDSHAKEAQSVIDAYNGNK